VERLDRAFKSRPSSATGEIKSSRSASRPALRKARPLPNDWAGGDGAKYLSYREAWARINLATRQGFFLEAVTVSESIISDRLHSFLQKTCGLELKPADARSLGKLTQRWAAEFEARLADDPTALASAKALRSDLDDWRQRRNEVVHGLVKSSAPRGGDHIDNFLGGAQQSAIEGKRIARNVSEWVVKVRKREKLESV